MAKVKQKGPNSSFLEINEFELDKEWIGQPKLYFQFAERVAKARQRLDEKKMKLEVVKAELDKSIRDDPGAYDIEKLTEKVVEAAVLRQEELQDVQRDVNQAQYDLMVVQAALSALDHRKKALEKLVDLFLANYFASPSGSKRREGVEELTKQSVRCRGHDGTGPDR